MESKTKIHTVLPTTTENISDCVKSFWSFMTKEYGTEVINKINDTEMQLLSKILNLLNIVDADAFLHNYVTTIGKRIYVPFDPGVENADWDLWDQIIICVHEHQHVVELERDGWTTYTFEYLLSSAARAAYEAEAYGCSLEINFWRSKEMPDPTSLANNLKDYACSDSDIGVAAKVLSAYTTTISRGGIINAASQKAIAWLDLNAQFLKTI